MCLTPLTITLYCVHCIDITIPRIRTTAKGKRINQVGHPQFLICSHARHSANREDCDGEAVVAPSAKCTRVAPAALLVSREAQEVGAAALDMRRPPPLLRGANCSVPSRELRGGLLLLDLRCNCGGLADPQLRRSCPRSLCPHLNVCHMPVHCQQAPEGERGGQSDSSLTRVHDRHH